MKNTNQKQSNVETSCDVLIVGAGQAGARVAQHLREEGYAGSVLLLGDEPHPPYERPPLSKAFLASECEESSLMLQAEHYWSERNVQMRLGTRVGTLDRAQRAATLDDGTVVRYGTVVIATGGAPRQLRLPGSGVERMLALRTLADAHRLRDTLAGARRLAIVGGGVIGLEVASTARKAGLEVQVFEAGAYPMGRVLCLTASQWLADLHKEAGVILHLGARLERIDWSEKSLLPPGRSQGKKHPLGGQQAEGAAWGSFLLYARSADGAPIAYEADVAVAAIGIDVEQGFLVDAGLGDGRGVRVDAHCRSVADANCYAAGDVAWTDNAYMGRAFRQETWRNAENQAQAVAQFIAGTRTEPYEELPWMWTDQHGRNIQVVGTPVDVTETVVRGRPGKEPFSIYWLRDGVLRGGVMVDSGRDRRFLEQLTKAGKAVPAESLADPAVSLKSLL